MKNFCEKHQHRQWRAVFVDVWSLTFFHTFCWSDKRMKSSFLEAVPRLVICHLLQPVFQLLLRLAAAAVVVLFLFFFFLKIVFKITSLRT